MFKADPDSVCLNSNFCVRSKTLRKSREAQPAAPISAHPHEIAVEIILLGSSRQSYARAPHADKTYPTSLFDQSTDLRLDQRMNSLARRSGV
jgi:hypothetical protein